ncbi:MAG: iron-sulfur cluster assembly accessory protein [Hydrogenovibrio crunogenus]|uniref:Iron-sulfur cluster assembly accessory protein n=1 Tax=Hydrogenovibrio crunogenus (strain DSM 25203 / XCL-2) TaxID=317025 RepID=Q31I09_HYDCU|nr:iron-sulfur cluster assembly accessory protein [Hydrogenovibrio crunogenus]
MAVTLTQAAADRVNSMLEKRGHGIGLRVGTKVSGCAGFSYVVDYADEITDNDEVFESFGVKVVVNQKSLEQIDGMELDYVKESLLNEGFEFNNPRVKDSCGCGESFTV